MKKEKFDQLVNAVAELKLELALVPTERQKIFGPYKRADGRQHAVVLNYDENGLEESRATVSWPKLKVHILSDGRVDFNLTVDHIDRNFTNDSMFNLQVLPRNEHATLDARRATYPTSNCVHCGNTFQLSRNQMRTDTKKAGPFCSRSCSGKYGQRVGKGEAPLDRAQIPPIQHFKLEKK